MQNVINDVKESIELETEEEIVDEGKKVVQALEKLREEVKNDAVLEYIPFLYPNEFELIPPSISSSSSPQIPHLSPRTDIADPSTRKLTQQSNPGIPNSLPSVLKQLTFPDLGSTSNVTCTDASKISFPAPNTGKNTMYSNDKKIPPSRNQRRRSVN